MLKELFDDTHFQEFPPEFGQEQRRAMVAAIQRMIEQSNIATTYRVTDEGIEFGFTDLESADALRLNLMAMQGDFGAHRHTQSFDHPQDQADYAAVATHLAAALGMPLDIRVRGKDIVLDFERSEDWVIFMQTMETAAQEGVEEALRHGKFMQEHMRELRADLTTLRL